LLSDAASQLVRLQPRSRAFPISSVVITVKPAADRRTIGNNKLDELVLVFA
jgi:hypothetical protein